MGLSRYSNTPIRGNSYGTWSRPRLAPGKTLLDGLATVDHVWRAGDRFDILADLHWGDGEDGWLIALSNDVVDPFSVVPGRIIRIAVDRKKLRDRVG